MRNPGYLVKSFLLYQTLVDIGLTDLPKTEGGGTCPTALIAWKGGGLKNKDSEMKLSPKGHSKLSSKISFYSG